MFTDKSVRCTLDAVKTHGKLFVYQNDM